MSGWNHAICERCWISRNMNVSHDEFEIRRPYRLNEPEMEFCGFCGGITIFGVYVRADPDTVPFPRKEPDERPGGDPHPASSDERQ